MSVAKKSVAAVTEICICSRAWKLPGVSSPVGQSVEAERVQPVREARKNGGTLTTKVISSTTASTIQAPWAARCQLNRQRPEDLGKSAGRSSPGGTCCTVIADFALSLASPTDIVAVWTTLRRLRSSDTFLLLACRAQPQRDVGRLHRFLDDVQPIAPRNSSRSTSWRSVELNAATTCAASYLRR